MNFDWPFFWHYLLRPSAAYLNGLMLTLVLSVVAQTLGTTIGLFAALGRMSVVAPAFWCAATSGSCGERRSSSRSSSSTRALRRRTSSASRISRSGF